jgi:tetrapyrrole methylase family protein/MazG family protein
VSDSGRVVVVGLGPAGVDLLLPAARAAIEGSPFRYARTERHPALEQLRESGIDVEPFDPVYESAASIDEVYTEIVDVLVDSAREHGEVVYAVPGNPAVAERTVELLHEAARAGRVEVHVVPGLSFADLAWGCLGVDPMAVGARVVDGHAFDASVLDAGAPVLVAQCDSSLTLSDVKLALLERLDASTPVTVLARLGLADQRVERVPLEELDRVVDADHLTAVYVDSPATSATGELARLLALAVRLRRPGGCPWDAEQTHHSLSRYLLEEGYEVVEAIEQLPPDAPEGTAPDDPAYAALVDELGDLLYQVIFHAVLADEIGAFGMAEVARGIHDKLVRRHPHVFGDVEADTGDAVTANWEQIKKEEKGTTSVVEGITPGLPSLLYTHKLLRKAASIGIDPGDMATALDRIDSSSAALRTGAAEPEEVLGELLAATVVLARDLGVDTESALRGWAARFRDEVAAQERRI